MKKLLLCLITTSLLACNEQANGASSAPQQTTPTLSGKVVTQSVAEVTRQPNPRQWYLYDENIESLHAGSTYYGAGFFNNQTKTFIPATGKGIYVGIVDSGYIPHPDIINNLQPLDESAENKQYGYTFSSTSAAPDALQKNAGADRSITWHGPWISSEIVGKGGSGGLNDSVLGAAPDAKIVMVKREDQTAATFSNALLWLAGLRPTIPNQHPVRVINISQRAGGTGQCPLLLQQTIDNLLAHGVFVVIAAGNDNLDIRNILTYPIGKTMVNGIALCTNTIIVTAVGPDRKRAAYSNYGFPEVNPVFMAAPGGVSYDVDGMYMIGYTSSIFTAPGDPQKFGYDTSRGTSFAAPLVVAAIADMLSVNPNLSFNQIKQILQSSATPFASDDTTCSSKGLPAGCLGVGILNAAKAIELTQKTVSN